MSEALAKNLTDEQWLALMKIYNDDDTQGAIFYPEELGRETVVILRSGTKYRIEADGEVTQS